MSDFSFTLQEIKQELENLGYKNVPVEKLREFKADLELLLKDTRSIPGSLQECQASLDGKSSSASVYRDELSSVTTGDSEKRMKRKTLRKHNGKVSVEETYTTDGSVITASFSKTNSLQELRSKSVSSNIDPLGFTAVIKSVSYESSCRLNNKSDPVSRYHEYQRFWNQQVIPGEKKHKKLRWQIRNLVSQYEPVINKNNLLPVNFTKKYVRKKVVDAEWA